MLTYHKTWKRLNRHQLRKIDTFDFSFSFDSLFSGNPEIASTYFMGLYSESGIKKALNHYGIIRKLSEKGYVDLHIRINTKDPFKQRVALYNQSVGPEFMLGELVLQRKKISVTPLDDSPEENNWSEVFLSIEWLLLQDIHGKFTDNRPQLPGQNYPGLGIGKTVLTMIYLIAWHMHLNGLLNVPEYYHNAAMYSKRFSFIDPVQQGMMDVFKRDLLSKYSLPIVTWAMELGYVYVNQASYKWNPVPQIVPLSKAFRTYLKSGRYNQIKKETMEKNTASLDLKAFREEIFKKKNGLAGLF